MLINDQIVKVIHILTDDKIIVQINKDKQKKNRFIAILKLNVSKKRYLKQENVK